MSLTLAQVINDSTLALECIQLSLNSLAKVDLVTELPFLFVDQCGVCAVGNTPCYNWVNATCQVEGSLKKFEVKATWISNVDPDCLLDLFSCLK